MYDSEIERFNKRIAAKENSDCWWWTGYVGSSGYGRFNIVGLTPRYAHRIAWEITHEQEVPRGLVVMHLCNNRLCVNPAHLQVGTQRENLNMARKDGLMKKPHQGATHCKNGHEYTTPMTYDRRGYKLCVVCKPRVRRYKEQKNGTGS